MVRLKLHGCKFTCGSSCYKNTNVDSRFDGLPTVVVAALREALQQRQYLAYGLIHHQLHSHALCSHLTMIFSLPSQCGQLTVQWDSTGDAQSSPLRLSLLPINQLPLIFDIPPGSDGSFIVPNLALREGTQFSALLEDGNGQFLPLPRPRSLVDMERRPLQDNLWTALRV